MEHPLVKLFTNDAVFGVYDRKSCTNNACVTNGNPAESLLLGLIQQCLDSLSGIEIAIISFLPITTAQRSTHFC